MPSSAPPCLPSSSLPLLLLLLFATPSFSQVVYVTVPYFNATSLACDHALNATLSPAPVMSITWILPDGAIVDATSAGTLDPRRYAFSGPDPSIAIQGVQDSVFDVFTLTLLRVDDDDFGYYDCVVVGASGRKVSVARYGLNVDGADFSKLMDEYRENAIVGGVAAAAMLVLVGGACLIWNFRFANRMGDDDVNGGEVSGVVEIKHHDNSGYKTDIEMSNIDVAVVGEENGSGADARA